MVSILKVSLKYMERCVGPAHWSVFVGNLGCFLFSIIINSSARKVFVHKSTSASDYFLREDSWKGNSGLINERIMKNGRGKRNKLNELGCLTQFNWENKKHLTSSRAKLMVTDVPQAGSREAWWKGNWIRGQLAPGSTSFLFTARGSWDALRPVLQVKRRFSKCPACFVRGGEEPPMACVWMVPSPTWLFLL